MSSNKRRLDGTRSGDEVVQVLESASAELRHARKRLRLSDEHPVLDSVSVNPEELFTNGIPSTQFTRHSDFREEHDRDRDELSDVDSDVEERKIEETTQMIRKDRQRQRANKKQNQALEAGILETVTCTNFMCHPRLTIPFGPNINFIIGHNGSGKSAVLTAITLCLGGKATSTNRGQSLKSFIREGQESAVLAVQIKNEGETAYKTDLYGPSITVERHFNVHGVSGFRIKSADGRVVSTKRAELDEITDYYALQLDNPVNVLTQDMARQFLNNSSGSDKYKFLVKGVLLEQLDRDYCLVADSLNGTDVQLESVQEDCRVLQEKHEVAQKKLERSKKQDSLRDRIRMYARQSAWAQELEQLTTTTEEAQAKIETRRQEASTISDNFDCADREAQDSTHRKEELEHQLDPLESDERDATSRLKEYENEMHEAQKGQRTINSHKDSCKSKLKRAQDQVDAEKKRLEEHSGGAGLEKQREIDQAERSVKDLEAELRRMAEGYPELEKAKQQADKKVHEAHERVKNKEQNVSQAQKRLNDMEKNRGSSNAGYHEKTPQLLKTIQQDNRYSQKPIGPAGYYVRLLRPEWSSILEKSFGSNLDAFIVTSKKDQVILANTMRQLGYHRPINVTRPTRIDTSQNEPDEQVDTIMRILEITHDLVRKHLIINNAIDQVVLIQNQTEANMYMYHERNEAPRNVKACLFMQSEPGVGGRYSYGRGHSHKDDYIEAWSGSTRMKSDDQAQINIQRQTVDLMKQALGDAERHKASCVGHQQKCSQAIQRHKKEEHRLRTVEIDQARDAVMRKRDELDGITPQDGKLESLKKEVEEAEENLRHYEIQLRESNEELQEMHQAKIPLDNDAKAKRQLLENKKREVDDALEQVRESSKDRMEALKAKNEALSRIRNAEEDAEKVREEQQQQQETVNDFIEKASTISPRVSVDPGMTGKKIDRLLAKLHNDLQNYEAEVGGDSEQIHREAAEAKQAHIRAERHFDLLKQLQRSLMVALQERRARWKKFRSAITTRARSQFLYLLSERGYRGRMLIDHVGKELELQVEPDDSNKQSGRQTKTLSGGEKSFTTICMLLALWDAMGSPIRCLDEFDVFMDSVNRDISVQLLIDSARMSVGRQFILITPQAMGTVQSREDVKVIRLKDPERGQTALNIPGA